MIYQATHHVNFAQGEMATLSTFIAWSMVQAGMPYWVAFFGTVVVSFGIGVVVERILIRPVSNAPVLTLVGVFIGLLLIVGNATGWIFGYTTKVFPTPFTSDKPLFGGLVSAHELGSTAVTLTVLTLVWACSSASPSSASRCAPRPTTRARRASSASASAGCWRWAGAWPAAIGAVAGMMVAPVVFLDPTMMLGILLYAFAGALMGGIDNPAGAVIGGFSVGVLENLAGAYVRRHRAQADGGAWPSSSACWSCVPPACSAASSSAGCESIMSASKGLESAAELGAIAAPPPPPAWQRAILVLRAWSSPWRRLFVLESFHLFQLTMAVIMALAVLGLNIVTGYNGQISLGHGAFFAVGAYITAILMSHWTGRSGRRCPSRRAICATVGFAIGFPALRLAGHYLALTTFSLAVAVPQILKHKSIEDWTGGVQGLFLVKPDAPAGIALIARPVDVPGHRHRRGGAASCWSSNLIRSRIGRALMATRDHPTAAEAMGMDIATLKTAAFAVSAMITGIAGSLSAVAIEFVAPDSFGFGVSITLFVGMVVGGVASILGSLFGGLFVLFVPNIAEAISKAAPGVIYGVILIAFLFLLPDGFAGLLRAHLRNRLRGRRLIPETRLHDHHTSPVLGGAPAVALAAMRWPCRHRAGPRKARASPRPRSASAAPMRCPARLPPIRVIPKCLTAMFKRLNEQGGIAGRQVNFIVLDDAYSPPKTLEQARRLVEQDKVAFLFNNLGTPTNSAIHRYMNPRKVPHLFLATGADKWANSEGIPLDHRLAAQLPDRGADLRQVHPGAEAGREDRRCSTRTTISARTTSMACATCSGARFDAMVKLVSHRGDRRDHRQPDRLAAGGGRRLRWSAASSRASPRRRSARSTTSAGSR